MSTLEEEVENELMSYVASIEELLIAAASGGGGDATPKSTSVSWYCNSSIIIDSTMNRPIMLLAAIVGLIFVDFI